MLVPLFRRNFMVVIAVWLCLGTFLYGQTAQSGALTGLVTDQSGSVVPGVGITITDPNTGQVRTTSTRSNGRYLVPLLPPGVYKVEASREGFKTGTFEQVRINITETATLNIPLHVGSVREIVDVEAEPMQLDTISSALGHVTDERMVENLPLVTRNYTQILGLSPGVSGDVTNSAHIGRGDSSLSSATGGYSIAGGSTNDNNFQMNGTEVNDLMGENAISGGVPVPNPDSIQEFKVQVGQYDASYGRNAGANVDVVTKSGANQFHGDVWEYFRNTALNANDFFLKRQGLPRGVLNQNQFGGTLGGPVVKSKVMFFVSYQGTRQRDGLDNTAGCLTTGSLPSIGNDPARRTAAALAQQFNGQVPSTGLPIASAADISPTALAVLNAQLPNGQLVVPAPQNAATGVSTFTAPCHYRDDQFISNVDLYRGEKSHISGKFFFMNSEQQGAFPNSQLLPSVVTVPGFPQTFTNGFRNFSLTHTYAFNSHLLNQATLGFHRLAGALGQEYSKVNFANSAGCTGSGAFTLSSICVPAPAFDNPYPNIEVEGPLFTNPGSPSLGVGFNVGGNGQGVKIYQNYYDFSDSVSYVLGKHSLHVGGGINRTQINLRQFHFFGGLVFLSFPDFLVGAPALGIDVPGVFDRNWRVWDGNFYIQDNYQILPRLTLNLGIRYERQGQLGEYLGRASTFDPSLSDPNPPDTGSLNGFVVASNFTGGAIPPGVIRAGTNTAIANDGQNNWAPRIGFAWQIPGTNRVVLRGGYGLFYTRTTGEPFLQLLAAPPWGEIRQFAPAGAAIPDSPAFPIFQSYFPPTAGQPLLTPTAFSQHFRAPILQRYSLNLQTAIANNWMLEVGYQGGRGTKLLQSRLFNEAGFASPSNPIRGQTTNDFLNIAERVPIEGFDPAFSTFIESAGSSWYNALGASLSKRFSHGLQFLASYTLASALETNPGYTTGSFSGGGLIGDQNARANYGFDDFVRPQRFVLSYTWEIPGPQAPGSWKTRLLDGWSVNGVTTFQNGQRLTLVDNNLLNAFGIGSTGFDRAQLAAGCTNHNLATSGAVTSRIDNYFNPSCFGPPPIIGSDGLGTGFGNSGNGVVVGPDQRNFDISLIKKIPLNNESRALEFRAEFFNAFNTPSFANPDLNTGTMTVDQTTFLPTWQANPNFGHITATSVAPRVIQFALKLYF